MKKPVLGKQTFLPDNTGRVEAFEKFVREVYDKNRYDKPLYTGRYFVIFREGVAASSRAASFLKSECGLSVANTREFVRAPISENSIDGADALIYEDLGIALVGAEEEQIRILEASGASYMIVPEKIVYVPDEIPAVLNVPSTWGIDVTQAMVSGYTGNGVKVAVLDTGFDANHPDFAGRNITVNSFVPEESAEDMHGHGTHCIGSACGNVDANGMRYGVAKNAAIYAGKVLSNEGSGAQAWILNGMTWAADNGCNVISMSLGSRVFPGQSYDVAYERAAQYALSKGTVVIAAAGNESRRSMNQFSPVGSPADCPSIMAVAALDSSLNVADFSNRKINPNGGEVDIAGPGVEIYSSWPMPMRYRTISGTSMATPHVAGLTALLWEKFPNATPYQIMTELRNLAKRLPISNIDVGVGLSIAPVDPIV
ncbi:S8 family peptidase [Dyadobacter crusticola]|uniref:S8 family peptidase n=1 Tax=Dyadobacter crusticola TaxID=292407 RepID=UPI00068B375D|nr:S8 family serine peptidase [Dyadobacter crusticola]